MPSQTGTPRPSIRLLIADDHPLFLDGLEAFFGTQPDVMVVGRCRDGNATLHQIRELRPDVVIIDRQLPKLAAVDLVRQLVSEKFAGRVIIFVTEDDDAIMLAAMELGVRGFLHKSIPSRLIGECVRKVHAGGYWLEKQVTAAAVEKMVRREATRRRLAEAGLTRRETEIATLAAQNIRTEDISRTLRITTGTAKLHLHQVYRKLNLSGRLDLLLFARETGLS